MDKIIINAVAGSGKTKKIIDLLDKTKRTAIITYTITNQNSLKDKINAKFGYIPDKIHVFGYWDFLYNFCVNPLISEDTKGFIFDQKIIAKINRIYFYKTPYIINGYFIKDTLAKYALTQINSEYLNRINRYFDIFYVDEVQDFSSYDLDWILNLSNLSIPVFLVGDFFQKTFSTSQKGNKGRNAFYSFKNWKNKFEKASFFFDEDTLKKSYRCSPKICSFINKYLNIPILSQEKSNGSLEFIQDEKKIKDIYLNNNIYKLFYQNSKKFDCVSMNWGESKGKTLTDVCVVLNPTTFKLYKNNNLNSLKNSTKSKFYVACTRASRNLYLVSQKTLEKVINS